MKMANDLWRKVIADYSLCGRVMRALWNRPSRARKTNDSPAIREMASLLSGTLWTQKSFKHLLGYFL